ncbi:MAG: hypothetical protein HOH74_15250, partial [Gemmatimonadetes bacterium]|nr:hypothetical protein [Gemmatimonadota bacterium]
MALIKDPTHQYAMTVVVPVADDQVQPLRSLLNAISAETVTQMQRKPVTVLVPFHAVESLHYARFFLAVASEEHDDPAMLVLSTNFDGPQGAARRDEKGARAAHIRDLAAQAHAGLDEVFSYCMGYTPGADQQQLVAFLEQEQHQVQANTFYVGSSGRSRNQILEEYQFRNQIESAADRVAAQPPHNDPQEVRARIITELESAGVEIPPPFPAQPDGVLRHLLAAPKWPLLFLIAAADLLLAAVACRLFPESYSFWQFALGGVLVLTLIGMGLYITLRRHEKRDIPDDPGHSRATTNHVAYASSGENHFMQNQLTHLVDMKPGLFRMMTIRTVFWALQVLATNVFNRGKLGNIPSIHFARWVFLGSKRRVLFFSNFDNSWQSYLGDFVDQASTGLTAVWSNTKGYPRTRNLLDAGSRNSTAFLAWTRAHQLPTDVWYSAYPALSIKNVNDNTLLRRGIADPSCIPASDWLRALAGEDLEPQKTPEPPDSQPELVDLPVDDIQGLILKGYGFLEHAAFIMLRVTDPALARKWIAELPVTPASMGSNLDHPQQNHPQTKFVNVAFTHSGLTALELDKTLLDGFPVEFVEGSHDRSRSRILGDVGANDPENWQWGNEDQRVDVLLMVYCH